MRIVVDRADDLPIARRLVDSVLDDVEYAASRFRADGEIRHISTGTDVAISPALTELLAAALDAAARTEGAVDPTVGTALRRLGYDRDIDEVRKRGPVAIPVSVGRRATWRDVHLDRQRHTVLVPKGVQLDLGATAKAWAADRAAALVADSLGIAVLVSLGGDIATAGRRAAGAGWDILVQDRPQDPAAIIHLPDGLSVATSSSQQRTWRGTGMALHHILDPATGMPAERFWRSATVVAPDCVTANAWSTAALVRGGVAVRTLRDVGLPARLVAGDGRVRFVGGWPTAAELGGAA